MNSTELIKKLGEYGADTRGIARRFSDDFIAFGKRFLEFLGEDSSVRLEQAIKEKNYGDAEKITNEIDSTALHLGIVPLSSALDALSAALKEKNEDKATAAFADVSENFKKLGKIVQEADTKKSGRRSPRKPKSGSVPVIAVVLVLLLVLTMLVFTSLVSNYRKSAAIESAGHLEEINYQIKLYMEEKIKNDWNAAYSVARSVTEGTFDSSEALLGFIQYENSIWDFTDVVVYAENGSSLCCDGITEVNPSAQEVVDTVRTSGEYVMIADSSIIYIVPLETELTLNGSKIAAVSIVQNVDSFIDDMGFSSFNGAAYMYLTEKSGVIISKSTHKDIVDVENLIEFIDRYDVVTLYGDSVDAEDMFASDIPTTFLMERDGVVKYLVAMPISTSHVETRVFYFVPESVVNRTSDSFSRYIVTLCVAFIVFVMFGSVLIFISVYRMRSKRFVKELAEREYMFDMLVQNTNNAFALLSTEKEKPLYNSVNSENITGYKYIGLTKADGVFRLTVPDEESEGLMNINRDLAVWDGTDEFISDYIPVTRNNSTHYLTLSVYPVDKSPDEFVGIAQDVTPQYKRDEVVKTALNMAERANTAKSRFLSNMSHDIRTPMNAIVNMTNFAIESVGDPKKQSEYLGIILESSNQLLSLINDILDMSRIESGEMVIESKPFDVVDEIKKIADIISPLCAAKHQNFVTDFSGVSESGVTGDRIKLTQIIMNLLSNAVKFTPENGKIQFSASNIPSLRKDIVSVRFAVKDNGIGIAKNDAEHIFEPFSRVDNRRVSKTEGTGLGLSICKNYAEAMGGTIKCESEEDSGSTFTVELFFEKAQVLPDDDTLPVMYEKMPFEGKSCLLCEDNAINQVIAKTLLERIGFSVEIASNGSESVSAFLSSENGDFDIIYMDIQMPVMDGYEATEKIRRSAHPQAKTVPIVAMTANVFADDVEKARASGMNGHLNKPIIVADLIERTYKIFREAAESEPQ